MAHNVLVLGNGFDLDLGYRTKYSDFVNSSYWPFKEKNLSSIGVPNLQNYIYDFTDNNKDELGKVRWIDIEQLLKNYAISKNNKDSFNTEIVKNDEACYQQLVNSFADYLKNELLNCSLQTILKPSRNLIEAISRSSKKWKGYSFNYTDSRAIIDFLLESTDAKFRDLPFTHLHGQIDIHGKDDTLILGIDDSISIPTEYKFLRKSWNPNYESHKLDEDLLQAEHIVCFGWSFGEIDRDYLKDFFHEICSIPEARIIRKGIHFITYDEQSRINILNNLEAIGIQMSRLKKYTDIDFYLTSQMCVRREMDKFYALCEMLSK